MLGQTNFEQALFSTIDLNTFVPKNHLLRRLDKIIDLTFVRELSKPFYHGSKGRPSVDPVTYFRMQIVAHLYGIKSDRRLCEEVHLNLAYRWFARIPLDVKVPDHSSMTRTRDRLGEDFYQSVFDKIISQCKKIGLLKGERLMMDASIFEANASPESLINKNKTLRSQQDTRKEEKGNSKKRDSDHKVSNASHTSKTDPDAKIVHKAGTSNKRLYYKTHHIADADSRVITDCVVTSGNVGDCSIAQERMEVQKNKYQFKIIELMADRFYGNGEFYSYLEKSGIEAFIPNMRKSFNEGHGSNIGFKYIKDKDIYICKEGHTLRPYKKPVGKTFVYRMLGCHCKSCPQKSMCLSGKKQLESETKVINRNIYEDYINNVKAQSNEKNFKERIYERFWKMEGLFAEAKDNHCLRRAKYRGKEKVQIQVTMTAITQNLKRCLASWVANLT